MTKAAITGYPAHGRASRSGLTRSPGFSPYMALFAVVGIATVMRVAFAATTGLGNDESYSVVMSRELALSYFDHPPLSYWLVHLAVWLTGSEAPLIVRAPFLIFSTLSTLLLYQLTKRLFYPWAGVLASLMMACAPVLGVTSASWVLPDGPLITFLLAGTLVLAKVLFDETASPANWLLAGFLGGIATLSKYHGIFFFAGTFLFLVTSSAHRFWLKRAWPYAGAFVALLVFLPVLIWNVDNDFASMAFQGSRATAAQFRPWMVFVVIAGTALFLTPWIWVGLISAAWRAVLAGNAAPRSWFLLCLAAGPIVLFPVVAAWSAAKPFFHWSAPGYLMLFPLLGFALARGWESRPANRRWVMGSTIFVITGMFAFMALSLVPSLGSFGSIPQRDPLRELDAWSGLSEAFRRNGLTLDRYRFVASRIWHEGGKIGYALGSAWPIARLGIDCRGFQETHVERGSSGDDVLVVVPRDAAALRDMRSRFASLEEVETIDIRHDGTLVEPLTILIGRCYRCGARR